MRHLKENLLVQFSVAGFVVMAVIAVFIAMVLSNKIRSDAVDDLVDEAVSVSTGRLLSAIAPSDLEVPMTGQRYDKFHEFVQQSIVSERTARIKVVSVGPKEGTEGVAMAAAQRPDAILLDVMMPGMDGHMTLDQLRSRVETEGIPVILLTAKVLPADQSEFAAWGVA